MPSKVYSATVVGVEAFEVEIEVHAGWGNTDKIAVVGLPDTAVKESKDWFYFAQTVAWQVRLHGLHAPAFKERVLSSHPRGPAQIGLVYP